MDANLQWNIGLCLLISLGTPYMPQAIPPGMSAICPLKTVTLFVLQLTRRANHNPIAPSIYLPLSYDITQNTLYVYIPQKSDVNIPFLVGIDGHLRQFCDQFRNSGNPGCVIYPAIRQLLSIPNLNMLYQ